MDDTQDALDMMTLVLESAGFHVASAMCVTDALAQLAAGHFDGLVTDFNLPDGTGSDLIDRAMSAGLLDRSRTAVLICTASSYVAPLSNVRVLYKPLDTVALIRAVEHGLGGVKDAADASAREA